METKFPSATLCDMRKVTPITGEYYHVFNRGVDKREIYLDLNDLSRFFLSMDEFNVLNPIGSIFENSFRKERGSDRLVEFICYCLNPNHYHFLLKQLSDKGIEKFMHKLNLGYTKYFNQKHKRTGTLFQGPFKCKHVSSNEYLLHLGVYINLNYKVHELGNLVSKSSWLEYIGQDQNTFCSKDIILGQFKNSEEYTKFSEEILPGIREKKELEKLLLE